MEGTLFTFRGEKGLSFLLFRFIGLHREATRELVNDIFVWDNLATFSLNEILPRATKYK